MKAPYLLISITLVLMLSNCQPPISNQYPELIKGDWVSIESTGGILDRHWIFSFEDTSCAHISPWGAYTDYRLNKDTLFIQKMTVARSSSQIASKEKYIYKILQLNDTSLSLSPISSYAMDALDFREKYFDTLSFYRLKNRNQLSVKHLGFYSSICYGRCPSMYLEIDSARNFYFYGKSFTEKEGPYVGQLPKAPYQQIIRSIHQLPLHSLQEAYQVGHTDAQTCGIRILTHQDTIESHAYGYGEEPKSLRLLFHKLMEVYKQVELKEDSTIYQQLLFKELSRFADPPLPPASIDIDELLKSNN